MGSFSKGSLRASLEGIVEGSGFRVSGFGLRA